MPCTADIDIPSFFAIYNTYSMYEDIGDAKWQFNQLKSRSSMIDKCIECGECAKLCPQQIDIPFQLKKMLKTMSFLFET